MSHPEKDRTKRLVERSVGRADCKVVAKWNDGCKCFHRNHDRVQMHNLTCNKTGRENEGDKLPLWRKSLSL